MNVYLNLKCCMLLVTTEQEMYQFAQETVKAEAWLKAKEPLISSSSREEGAGEVQAQTDEVEQLILRHEAFRKAAATWKERFSSLRQLSNVSSSPDSISLTERSPLSIWYYKRINSTTIHINSIYTINK